MPLELTVLPAEGWLPKVAGMIGPICGWVNTCENVGVVGVVGVKGPGVPGVTGVIDLAGVLGVSGAGITVVTGSMELSTSG